MTPDQQREFQIKLEVPDDQIVGHYANVMSVWGSSHDFTLDFAVIGQPDDPTAKPVIVPARVVARIKIPLAMAQDVLQALASQISLVEAQVGQPIPRFQDNRPTYPPPAPED
jgi:hypothetical protein